MLGPRLEYDFAIEQARIEGERNLALDVARETLTILHRIHNLIDTYGYVGTNKGTERGKWPSQTIGQQLGHYGEARDEVEGHKNTLEMLQKGELKIA